MAARKIPDEILNLFSKYCKNFGRRMKKDSAVTMFQTEYKLSEKQAETMFEIFDKDRNGELSMWEFQQFHIYIGNNVHNIFDMYDKLDKDSSGNVDISQAWDAMKTIPTDAGGPIDDDELLMYMKAAAGEEKSIDFNKCVNLICRIKAYKGKRT